MLMKQNVNKTSRKIRPLAEVPGSGRPRTEQRGRNWLDRNETVVVANDRPLYTESDVCDMHF